MSNLTKSDQTFMPMEIGAVRLFAKQADRSVLVSYAKDSDGVPTTFSILVTHKQLNIFPMQILISRRGRIYTMHGRLRDDETWGVLGEVEGNFHDLAKRIKPLMEEHRIEEHHLENPLKKPVARGHLRLVGGLDLDMPTPSEQ